MRPSRRFSLHESKKNFAGGDAAASALDEVQEGPSAVKLAVLPVSERPAGWLLRPLGRLLELGCVFRRERFPLSRHVVQLLAVLRVAHLMRDFAALDRTVEILQALTHRYLSPHRCLASAWFGAQCPPEHISVCGCFPREIASPANGFIRAALGESQPCFGARAHLGLPAGAVALRLPVAGSHAQG